MKKDVGKKKAGGGRRKALIWDFFLLAYRSSALRRLAGKRVQRWRAGAFRHQGMSSLRQDSRIVTSRISELQLAIPNSFIAPRGSQLDNPTSTRLNRSPQSSPLHSHSSQWHQLPNPPRFWQRSPPFLRLSMVLITMILRD